MPACREEFADALEEEAALLENVDRMLEVGEWGIEEDEPDNTDDCIREG